jgi:Na+-transporting NADH:ubiquinone oxidoreductase subunit A
VKFTGGYNILLEGKPGRLIETPPEPEVLYLPLRSRRFEFSEMYVEDGQRVNGGSVLARDPNNYAVPLLAPRAGVVQLDTSKRHIVLKDISKTEFAYSEQGKLPHIVRQMGEAGIKRYKLLELGAWQHFCDAFGGTLPDPLGTPQAVIVSTISLEPFVARGDVQLQERLLDFTRGLEHLQSLLEYQPIYLVMPDISSDFALQVRRQIRGYARAELIEIPLKYPYDNPNILARHLGLKRDAGPVWFVQTEGALAVDRALTLSKPCLSRIVSVAGSAVELPVHINVMTGYPIKDIRSRRVPAGIVRIINGGVLTGRAIDTETLGLDTECTGLTVLTEHTERELFGFARPGWDRNCYAACFLSSLRKDFCERFTTAMRGEERACVSCNFCEEVCPAGIMPHLLHKYLYCDLLEEAEQARMDLCIECGLCSVICPSKIDLTNQFIEAKAMLEKEKEEIRREKLRAEELQRQEEARLRSAKEKED